ncbi:hypothetical protein [Paenibacillus sp. NRS-1760]|uniref:hypothetical protein n=1 Tax=Paenibacillus sp. NRS-1760 TaxID=3233902 RepID=UPI003D2CE959
MIFLGLSDADKEKLQYEVISDTARLKLTRLIRGISSSDNSEVEIFRQNRFVNITRNVMNVPIYVLESDYWGEYNVAEYAWHIGEIELIMRRPNTIQLVEILADFVQNGMIDEGVINEVLIADGCSLLIERNGFNGNVNVLISSIDDTDDNHSKDEHPNIRVLVHRMERSLADKDYSAVIHASASIFETLAKDIVNLQSVQNQSLGNFFKRYRMDSRLPNPILDFIEDIFKRRNTEPLAGHGNLQQPTVNKEEAVVLSEMTKTFVRIERQLAMPQLNLERQVGERVKKTNNTKK